MFQFRNTVNSETFAIILFMRIAIKDIFAKLKSRLGHDYPISVKDKVIVRNQNKSLAKISEFTVFREVTM